MPETINAARLKQDIQECSEIGRRPEREGLYRRAFTAEEEAARIWLMEKIEEAGLALDVDGARNVFARVGRETDGPTVATGSHLDSVPGGGHLDGALGVLCGLECLRRMQELNLALSHPVELIAFTDEEARFGSMFGSKAVCGLHRLEDLRRTRDENGCRLEDALKEYGSSCEAVIDSRRTSADFHAFIELHIEQGPVLDRERVSVGVVTEIVGLFRWRALLKGTANHAGTTPMHMRRDALGGLIEFAAGIDRTLQECGCERSRATIGRVETLPGSVSVIPGEVRFLFDVRDPDRQRLQRLQQAFEKRIADVAGRRSLELSLQTTGELEPVQSDRSLADLIESAARRLGVSSRRVPSGATHDAATMASITKVAMVFVPSIEGISHSPLEDTHWPDIEKGANVLLNTLITLGQNKWDN